MLVQPGDIIKWDCCGGKKILGKREHNIFCLYKVNSIADNFCF